MIHAQHAPVVTVGSLAGCTSAVEFGLSVESKEVPCFGMVPYVEQVPGLKSAEVKVSAWQDFASGATAERLRALSGAAEVVQVAQDRGAVGSLAWFTAGPLLARPFISGKVGELAGVELMVSGNGMAAAEGLVTIGPDVPVTATMSGVGQQVGAVAAGGVAYGALSVLTMTAGATVTVALQSAASLGGAYTTRATSAALTAAGAVLLSSVAVTPHQWWRLTVTVTGTTPSLVMLGSVAVG